MRGTTFKNNPTPRDCAWSPTSWIYNLKHTTMKWVRTVCMAGNPPYRPDNCFNASSNNYNTLISYDLSVRQRVALVGGSKCCLLSGWNNHCMTHMTHFTGHPIPSIKSNEKIILMHLFKFQPSCCSWDNFNFLVSSAVKFGKSQSYEYNRG